MRERLWQSLVCSSGIRSVAVGACLMAAIGFGAPALLRASGEIDSEASRSTSQAGGTAALGVTLKEVAGGGVAVSGVMPNSPAADAGVRAGDLILAIDDQPVDSSRDVIYWVSSQRPGKKISLRVNRGGLQGSLHAVLLSRREVDNRAALGVTLSRGTHGSVRILAVAPSSPAAKAGIRMGDRITAVDGEAVESYLDVIRMIGKKRPGDQVRLNVDRYGLEGTLLATLSGEAQVFQVSAPAVATPVRRSPTPEDLLFENSPAQVSDQRGYGD